MTNKTMLDLLNAANEDGNRAGTLQEDFKKALSEHRKLVGQLVERVRAGETTGDRIVDIVLSVCDTLSPTILQNFRTIEQQLAEHQNQFLMLVRRTEDYYHRGVKGPRREDYYMITEFYMAIINGTQFIEDIPKGKVWYPVSEYVKVRHHSLPLRYGERLWADAFLTPNTMFREKARFTNPSRPIRYEHQPKLYKLDIIVGDEAVLNYAMAERSPMDDHMVNTYMAMTHMLGRAQKLPPLTHKELAARIA